MFTLIIEDKHGGIADEYSFEEGEFYIGRSHTSDIILPSDNVSRRHARLYTVDGRCYIEDLNSSNGVFVNGRRIHEVYQIQRSAQVKIGDYYLHIESDADFGGEEDRTFCRLVGRNLAFANQVFRVQRKVSLIGRGKDCTVTVIDPSVSRIHSKLTVERSGALTLEDLKSSNGTFVNDDRVEIATLNHRDVVRFGNVEFLVEVPDAEERSGVAPRAASRQRQGTSPGTATAGRRFETSGIQVYDDDWVAPRRKSRSTLWLVLSLVGGLLVLGAILLALFKDEIFRDSQPASTTDPAAEAADAEAQRLRAERERKQKELDDLVAVGTERAKNKQWELALEAWDKVVDVDPLNADARKAINQIKIWRKHQELLEEARSLKSELKRGRAAKLLREIDEASVYFGEAQGELDQLVAAKQTMLMTADNRLRQRDCAGALAQLKEIQQIDPRDTTLLDRIEDVEKKVDTRKCKKR